MNQPIVRVLRVLEYEGPADQVFKTLEKNAVKGTHVVNNQFVIREAIIGDVPALLQMKPTNQGEENDDTRITAGS